MVFAGTSSAAWAQVQTGDWEHAASALAAALEESPDVSTTRDLSRIDIELAAHRGVDVSARVDDYERIVTSLNTDIRARSDVLDLRAAVALAAGDLPRARELALQSHDLVPWAWALSPAARAAAWLGDVGSVRAAYAEFASLGVHGPMPDAEAVVIRAALAALEGRRDDALSAYRDALRRWRDLGLAWREALTVIDMATLLGSTEADVVRMAGPARETLGRIGARPYLARLEAALAATDPAPRSPSSVAGAATPEMSGRT
jgi:tetratricopeptide (TPR) repeat protein